ncbi:MAG: ABC transporter permease [Bryobacteraceae bacterium]|nr:ABC transporter permease [Bryobacteraceae bacterium]
MFTRVWAQIQKELKQILRDRLALTLAVGLPMVLMLLMGTALSLTPTAMPVAVLDYDNSPLSRQFLETVRSSLTLAVVALPDNRTVEQTLVAGEARAVLIVPADFGRKIRRNIPVEIQAQVDASDTNTANQIRGYIGQITRAFLRGLTTNAPFEAVQLQVRLWYNPGRDSQKFYGPGMLVFILSIFPPLLTALAMSREGEQKTILQVYVSSISAFEFLLGKALAYMVVALAEWALALLLAVLAFGLRFAGDPVPFLVASVLFLFCSASFGLLVGAAVPSQAVAVQIVSTGGFVLAFLMSGLLFPVSNIPIGIRWVSALVQARYFIDVSRDAFLQGGGWPAVGTQVAMVGVIGAFYFLFAWLVMRKMQVNA